MVKIEKVEMVHPKTGYLRNVNVDSVEKWRNSGYVPKSEVDEKKIKESEDRKINPPLEDLPMSKLKEIAAAKKIEKFRRLNREDLIETIKKSEQEE